MRKVVVDCMKNIHPIYHIKTLMIKRELAKDPALANENWDRFLPTFKKQNVKRRQPKEVREKKAYTPFPPAQPPSKVDLQLESGEYFLNEQQRRQKKREEKQAKAAEEAGRRAEERRKEFEPPSEAQPLKKKKRPLEGDGESEEHQSGSKISTKKKSLKDMSAGMVAKGEAAGVKGKGAGDRAVDDFVERPSHKKVKRDKDAPR